MCPRGIKDCVFPEGSYSRISTPLLSGFPREKKTNEVSTQDKNSRTRVMQFRTVLLCYSGATNTGVVTPFTAVSRVAAARKAALAWVASH